MLKPNLMKHKNLILAISVMAFFSCAPLFGQLSDRVNSPSTYIIGTRPVAGNMAVQIGTSYQDVADILDDNKDFETLPVVNLKYYSSDRNVFTIGLKADKAKASAKGELTLNGGSYKYVENESNFLIVPGFEKHFGPANILDVYIGGKVPFGLDRYSITEEIGTNLFSQTRNSLGYGLDFFVGLQAFIGDLPFAIGGEVVYSAFGKIGDKVKVESGGTTYYTSNVAPSVAGRQFDSLSASTMEVQTDLRVFLCYYFRR